MKKILAVLLILALQIFPQQIDEEIIDGIIVQSLPIDGPGGTLLITKKGKTEYEKSFGFADIGKKILNTNETVYQIGSISKQLTAAGIMLLVEEGKLKLTDTLTRFIPDFISPAEKVTVENLLLHNSGIQSFTEVSEWYESNWESKRTLEEVIELIKTKEFNFQPGEKFQYNNSGYTILAYIIEKISGKNYADFMQEKIFDPLNMNHTRHGGSSDDIGMRAKGYTLDMEKKEIKKAVFTEFAQLAGAGSIVSTAEDIAIWISAIKKREFLSSDSWQKFLLPGISTNFGDSIFYGYGITLQKYKGHNLYQHSGGMAGFLSLYFYFPDDDVEIIWLSNNDFTSPQSIVGQVANFIFKTEEDKRIAIDISDEEIKKYEGIFLNPFIKVKVEAKENELIVSAFDYPFHPYTLKHYAENKFFAKYQYGVYSEFLNEGGGLNVLTITNIGNDAKLFREGYEPDTSSLKLSEAELKKFEGVYSFAPGNDMKVYLQDGKLKASLPAQPLYTLIPVADNEFLLQNMAGFKMNFNLNEKNEIGSVTSSQPNGEFTGEKISGEVTPPKKEDIIDISVDDLKKYEGDYEFAPGNEMKVYIEDEKLKTFLKGQPEYTLVPVGVNEFMLKNMEGFKMIFEVNEKGEVKGVTSKQPNGNFKAKKK